MTAILAVALACAASVQAPDCSRANALDVVSQPVRLVTECQQVGQVLAVHLSLPAGGYRKIVCERRRG